MTTQATLMPPIFFINGPPGAGKTTLARALVQRFPFGIHIPVDDLREWVVSGIAHPVGWTDETTRQFQLAEQAAADLACRYQDAGFAVAIDHCQGPPSLDTLIDSRLATRHVVRVALVPTLEENLAFNASRANKPFDPAILEPTIRRLNPLFQTEDLASTGWIVLGGSRTGTHPSVEALVDEILKHASCAEHARPGAMLQES